MSELEAVGFEEIVEGFFIPFALDVTDASAIRQEIVDGLLDTRDLCALLRRELFQFLGCKILDLFFHSSVLVLKWGGGELGTACGEGGSNEAPRLLPTLDLQI